MIKTYKVIVDELPRNCYMCPFGIESNTVYIPAKAEKKRYWYKCFLTQKTMTCTKRNRFCPLEVNENDNTKVEARPQGKWVFSQRGKITDLSCSVCGEVGYKEIAYNCPVEKLKEGLDESCFSNFCPNCGADMRGASCKEVLCDAQILQNYDAN